jgi:DsbC/DsbD-like thiol-disulfide interchange protein
MLRLATALALLASLVVPAAADAARPRFIDVDLVAETARPKPGGSALVGLRMVPKPGWHSYWSNPGEAGFPTVVEWKAPDGVHFGSLRHPAPSLIEVAGMASYVHEGPHVLVSRMSLDRSIPAGTALPVTAEISWAACSEKLCVPEKATLSLQLTAGDGAKSADASLLRRAVAREPRPIDGGGFAVEGRKLMLELPATARLNAAKALFFPDDNGIAKVAGGRIVSSSPLRLAVPQAGEAPKVLTGVVTDGSSAYRLRLERKALAPEATAETVPAPAAEEPQETSVAPAAHPVETKAAPAQPQKADEGGSGYLPLAAAALLAVLAGIVFLLSRRARTKRA